MPEHKRNSVRIVSDQFISYKVYDDQKRVSEEGMALARNISKTGVLLENRSGFQIGSDVDLAIALSDEIINAKGRVRNVQAIDEHTFQIGIEFEGLTDNEMEKLASEFPDIL